MESQGLPKFKFFCASVFTVFIVRYFFFGTPSEEQMLAKFHQHKAEFEQIRLMLKNDKQVISNCGRIKLDEFGVGFADTTWSSGYVWCAERPSPLVEAAYSEMPMRDHACFSPIEDKWYLYQRR